MASHQSCSECASHQQDDRSLRLRGLVAARVVMEMAHCRQFASLAMWLFAEAGAFNSSTFDGEFGSLSRYILTGDRLLSENAAFGSTTDVDGDLTIGRSSRVVSYR